LSEKPWFYGLQPLARHVDYARTALDRQEDDMETKTVRALFERQVEAFTGSPEFAALEAGCGDYDAFIENVARAHLKSPQLVAFQFMLSRVSGRMARALATHRGLAAPALEWFTHHSEVDVRHAEQGLADLGAYAAYYEFTDDEALTIVEMTLRENVFTRRYFR